MTGKDRAVAAARWRGWLISVAIHGAVAGLIVLAARTATQSPKGSGLVDTRAPDREVSVVILDEPIRVGPKQIKPILVDPPAVIDTMPLLRPVPPTPAPSVAVAPQPAKSLQDSHNPPPAPPAPSAPTGQRPSGVTGARGVS